MGMKKEAITVPFESMPRLITESFLTNDQAKKIKDTFKDFTVVVRCKDCKYHDGEDGKNFCDCGNRPDDWFCADGRKDK